MKRKILLPILATLIVAIGTIGLFYQTSSPSDSEETERFSWESGEDEMPKEYRIKEALAWRFEVTKDLELGYPPAERLLPAINHTRRLQETYYSNSASRDGAEDARWKERGPNNIGGRTRAILIDANDPDRNKIWAGAVSGGLWYTEDITSPNATWLKVNDYFDNLSIGAIAQDPNNPQLMYFGTGETYTGFPGAGLFQSTDGGQSWEPIPSASGNAFQYTQSILVHPETSDVYAGTSTGLYKSTNNGASWTKVLGQSVGASSNLFYDIQYSAGSVFASIRNRIYKSVTGNANDWTAIGTGSLGGFPSSWGRCEFYICDSDPNFMYAIGAINGAGTELYASTNAGQTWASRGDIVPGGDFTNGQAWYDLDVAVDPFNCNTVSVGGVPEFLSTNGGFGFQPANGNSAGVTDGHVDQHLVLYDQEVPGRVFHGNDGGVYYRESGSAGPVQDKNNGYNVTQFYAGALHPEKYSNYILGGTQDNNSLRLNSPGVGSAVPVLGGDGVFCHIDQDDGLIQIVSSQNGNYSISTNGGGSFSGGVSVDGAFINVSDYDNDANILYAQTNLGDLYRYKISGGNETPVISTGTNGVTAIHADPNVDNRLYIGSFGGRVYRLDNAHEGANVSSTLLGQVSGTLLSIDVELGNPDHLLVASGNYGLDNNIYESFDGGETWVGVEGTAVGNLPDVPVNWAIFNPENADQAMIATEIGVWATDDLDGENTTWFPPVPGRGTPLVRTDMLQARTSDRIVLAATHGRGMFTSDVWADPKAILSVPRVAYRDGNILFNGSASINAESYAWDLGDGTTSTEEDLLHSYDNIGEYDVNLTINGNNSNPDFKESGSIKVLPNRPLPYTANDAEYGGSFESNDEQWGVDNVAGNSTWERGSSDQSFKFGANTGDNAFVIAKDSEFYEKGSESYLYLPNFDFSERTIYEFSFFARFQFGSGRDGFNIEYSTNKGLNWLPLGNDAENWYNFPNNNFATTTPFPPGVAFFTTEVPTWTKFSLDVSQLLGGQENVAFRFVFRSGNAPGNFAGGAIDDVKITKFAGEAVTKINEQSVGFDLDAQPDELVVKWSTLPEYYAEKFEIHTSEDGQEFTRQETVPAQGVVSSVNQSYTSRLPGGRNLYFVKIFGISVNESIGLRDTIEMPIMVANKNTDEGTEIFSSNPNPFTSQTTLTFTNFIDGDVQFELFDVAGRLLSKETQSINGVFTTYQAPGLATGLYILRYTVGDEESRIFRIYKAEN